MSINEPNTPSTFRRESHARSLLKGISWRFVAFLDTIAVVALVTWWMDGKPAIGHALQIGFSEFLIKYIVYYIHERIWEQVRSGDGLDQARTFKKAVSWRIVATSMTFIIAGFVLGAVGTMIVAISVIEFFSKFGLYYLHERIWLRLPLGRVRNWLFGRK